MAADLQSPSDAEMDVDEVDVQTEDEGRDDNEGDDEEAEIEASGEDSQSVSHGYEDDGPPTKPTTTQPTLKITLKLPPSNAFGSNNSPRTATPEELDYIAFKRTPRRRAKTKVIQDIDIESEDPTSPSVASDDAAQSPHESGSRSTGTPSASVKLMTTRQAVLASVVDSSHVSLNEGSKSKKQPLNETELALRKEETARKRKNLSEKKLEDEKAETINRLLKKQSRPKNKRTTALDDRSPLPSVSEEGEDADGDEEEDEAMDIVEEPLKEVKPVMYRWVSSLRVVSSSTENANRQVEMGITFSVPEAFIPPQVNEEEYPAARGPGLCAVEGCGKPRKYRVPRDWTIGACDSTHLRVVANQV
ncbi:hypothetical protein BYT27DRAFT_7096326 [Phlegmacium glaucopus]|nr:hypothetical protein BYT27DRAFT_7096326 [Phlegmacium glaucopus]